MKSKWWRELCGLVRPRDKAHRRKPRSYRLPRLEILERRIAPAGHTLADATLLPFTASQTAHAAGFLATSNGFDLYKVNLQAGDRISATVSAQTAGSGLQSLLRVFDHTGKALALDDQEGGDPQLTFQAATAGDYFLGVSADGNDAYDPNAAASGHGGITTGLYSLDARLTPAAPLRVDLTGSSFRLSSPDTAAWGDSVTVAFTVDNRGGLAADPSAQVQLLVSDNNTFAASAHVLPLSSLVSLAGLSPGQAYSSGTFAVALPALTTARADGFAASGPIYLGLRITDDPTHDANALDKSGVHRGEDWETLTIVTPASAGTTDLSSVDPNLNTRISDTLAGSGQTKVYTFTVTAAQGPGQLTAQLTPVIGSALVARLTLADSNGQVLIQSESSIVQLLQPGTYSLEVSQESTTPNPTAEHGYQLTTTFTPGLTPFISLPGTLLATGDFNHDGHTDILTITGSALTTYLGNGNGLFRQGPSQPLVLSPTAVVVGDFNNDGQLDVVMGSTTFNGVAMLVTYFGNGDGSFRAPLIVDNGQFHTPMTEEPGGGGGGGPLPPQLPHSYPILLAGDFNHDGKLDLVTAAGLYPGVLLGNGDGTFQPATNVISEPDLLAVLDFNNDGNLDLLRAGSTVPGNGDGTFQRPIPLNLSHTPVGQTSIAVGDFNKDGKPDLAIGNSDGTISILLGNGDGTFQQTATLDLGGNPTGVVAGDFNGDGKLDIAAVTDSGVLDVFLGKGDGTFQQSSTFDMGTPPGASSGGPVLGTGDFNEDGRLDLIVTYNTPTPHVSLFLGNGDGTFQEPSTELPVSDGTGFIHADFNNDGYTDLVTASSNRVTILLSNGDGTFRQTTFTTDQPVAYLVAADFNNDGRTDLAITENGQNSEGPNVTIYLGNGDGTFQKKFQIEGVYGDLHVGHFTNKNQLDLMIGTTLWVNNGDGTFREGSTLNLGFGPGFRAIQAVGDFTSDGLDDLVVANDQDFFPGFGQPAVYENNGDGTFTQSSTLTVPAWFDISAIAVGEFDNRGSLDLAIANGQMVSILQGDGNGDFQNVSTLGPFDSGVSFLTAGDFDNDGRLDLAVASRYSPTVTVFLNQGNDTFQQASTLNLGFAPASVTTGDFNEDGRSDLAIANSNGTTVSLFLSQGNGQFQPANAANSIPVQNTPVLTDLTGDGIPDTLILDQSGRLLFRRGLAGQPGQFAPFVVINQDAQGHLLPVRDFTIVQTGTSPAGLPLVAAIDQETNTVSFYVWSPAQQAFVSAGSPLPTGNLPVRIASADLTGNGLGDLVVANDFDDTVSIFLQQSPGQFGPPMVRNVGSGPSSITFANIAGQGRLDIVVNGQDSGDDTILFNDPDHTFSTQSRYRAGAGPFDVATGPDGTTITSQLETVSVAAGDFTSPGITDLVAVNRNTDSLTLLRGTGNGDFIDPQPNTVYPTGLQASQVVVGDFNHDGKPDIAVLVGQTSEIWVYLNNGDGTFAAPIKNAAGADARGLTFVDRSAANLPDEFLVGNEHGDILTLIGDGIGSKATGHFQVDRSNLNNEPAGAVQLAYLNNASQPATGNPDLVVVNTLGNEVLVYPGLPGGKFGAPTSYAVGFEPVAVLVADLNSDGVPDLAVVNQGSNDVSILDGQITNGQWTATPGPRLNSGGVAPLAIQAGNFTGRQGIVDLRVTNSGGQIVTLPGIGSNGQGTGFFNDITFQPPSQNPPVSRSPSMITLASASAGSTSLYGQAVTFTATVSAIVGGSGIPTGPVDFFDTTTNTDLGKANLSDGKATLTTEALATGVNAITATYMGDANFLGSGPSNIVTLTVIRAPSMITLTSDSTGDTSQFGAAVTFTATVSAVAGGSGTPTGSVDFFDTTTNTDLGTDDLSDGGSLTTSALVLGVNVITATYTGDDNFLGSDTSNLVTWTVTPGPSTITLTSDSADSPSLYGQAVTFTATVSAVIPDSGIPTGSVDFFDTTTNTDLGKANLSGGNASLTTSALAVGVNAITATYAGSGNFLSSSTVSPLLQQTSTGIILLDPTGSGALNDTGTGRIMVTGGSLVVNSSNPAAVFVSGNGDVVAPLLDVTGGISLAGNGKILGQVQKGQMPAADPLSSLAAPDPSSLTVQSTRALRISDNQTVTLNPGLYIGGIQVSGNAQVTLNPGIYYMQGGGFSVSGNGSVDVWPPSERWFDPWELGQGVLIYNAPSSAADTISLTGNGSVHLRPLTSGPYQGITFFQDRASTAPMTITGNVHVTGAIYAAHATLNITGNVVVNAPNTIASELIVSDLKVTNPSNPNAAASGPGGYAFGLGSLDVTPAAPLQADLTGSSFQLLSPDTAAWGDTVKVAFKVDNRGGAAADPSAQVQLLLSDNTSFSPSAHLFTFAGSSVSLANLGPGQAYQSGQVTLTLPDRATALAAGLPVSGPVYVGLKITDDPTTDSNSADKCGVHRGTDWDILTVLAPVPSGVTDLSQADPNLNTRVSGRLNSSTQVDTYPFTVSAALGSGRLTAEVTATAGTLIPRLTLSGPNGELLIQSDSGQIIQHLQPGTYFLSVSAQTGQGTYRLTSEFVQANSPFAPVNAGHPQANTALAAVVDVNGDGIPDLVFGTFRESTTITLGVALGIGDGTFTPEKTFTFNNFLDSLDSLVVADVNGDGHPDLIAVDRASDSVGILLGNGDGTFNPAGTFPTGIDPQSVVATDGNKGISDLMVTAGSSSVVLLNNGDGSFQDPQPLAVAEQPPSGTLTDVNGDGIPDQVGVNSTIGGVSVELGNGDGSFQPPRIFSLGISPQSVFVADVNGDGKPDLVGATNSGQVSVLLGNGDGSFQSFPTPFPLGSEPRSVAVADVNHDGHPDIIAANAGDNTVSVFLGNGDGSFQPPHTFPTGTSGTFAVAVADVNGDGRPDIILANAGAGTISVLLGNGDGSFQTPRLEHTPFRAGNDPLSVTVADVDGDGKPDLVAVDYAGGKVIELPGNGDGTFGSPGILAPVGPYARSVAVADVNGDGIPDLLVTYRSGYGAIFAGPSANEGSVSLLLGNRDGSFQLPRTLSAGNNPDAVAVADLNGDGHLDLIVADYYSNGGTVLLGNGDGTFQAPRSFVTGGPSPSSVAVGDLNGDARPDLVVLSGGAVNLLLGNGDGTFRSFSPTAAGVSLRSTPSLVDLDGDHTPDSVVLDRAGNILFRKGLPGTSNQFAPSLTLNASEFNSQTKTTEEVAARDLTVLHLSTGWAVATADATPAPDLSTANHLVYTVSLYTLGPNDAVTHTTAFSTTLFPERIAAGDLTGDGLDDLVVADPLDNSIQIAFPPSTGTTWSTLTIPVGITPSDIALVNVAGHPDGRKDIVVTDQTSGDVTVLLNEGNHTFAPPERFRAGIGLYGLDTTSGIPAVSSLQQSAILAAGNFLGTGRNDLVVVNRNAHSFTVLANDGNGGFANPQAAVPTSTSTGFTINDQPVSVVVGDFNHDGKPDLAILMQDSSQVWVYLNKGHGVFAGPIINAAGASATGLSFVPGTGGSSDRLLVGDAYGDVLTLVGDGTGHFTVDRSNLHGQSLYVGKNSDGQTFAVVADQNKATLQVYLQPPGAAQFDANGITIDSHTADQTLQAPGSVQLIDLNNNGKPDLVVADRLGNDVLVYQGLGNNQFAPDPISYPVGDEPVAVTAAHLKGDNVLDLAVANQGSNDISILDGEIINGQWTATPGPRLSSGGSGPLAIQVGNFTGHSLPDLRVTNSGGQIATVPAIGSNSQGSGFFNDTNLPSVTLPQPITQPVVDPSTGQEFVVRGDGGISVFNGFTFTSVFNPIGPGVTMIAVSAEGLVAAFTDGTLGLLQPESDGLLDLTEEARFVGQPSALDVLQDGDVPGLEGLQVYLTQKGSDVPLLLTGADFIPIVTQLPPPVAVAEGTSLPNAELTLVATLVFGGLVEPAPTSTIEAIPSEDVFALFLPPLQARNRGADIDKGGEDKVAKGVEEEEAKEPRRDAPAWESYMLGATEALQERLQRQQVSDGIQQFLATLKEALDQLQSLLAPPTTLPNTTKADDSSAESPQMPALVEEVPTDVVPEPPAEQASVVMEPAQEIEVFACADLLPTSPSPYGLPSEDDMPCLAALSAGE